jgi:DeoR family galactitol utilization operon repressor
MELGITNRSKVILNLLAEKGSLSVTDLSGSLGVSAVTIRNDLSELEDQGLLSRTHGGATLSFHRSIIDRQRVRIEEKTRIAKAAADLVRDGDTIMIEAGTTTALVARFLAGKSDVHIVTNSTLLFSYVRSSLGVQVTMTGGEFRKNTESLVGPIALRTIETLNVRLAFVGTDGFSRDRGLTTHLVEGGEVVKAMVDRAETSILVADSSKHGRAGFVTFLPLSAIDAIITDAGLPDTAREELAVTGVDLRIV